MYFREIIMWLNLRLALYGFTCFAGLAWPFYFIVKFANQVKDGIVTGSPLEIGQNFFNGAWSTPTSGFVSADTAVLGISRCEGWHDCHDRNSVAPFAT